MQQWLAGAQALDVVGDDDRCGRRVGGGGDMRRHDDAGMAPERMIGGQRLAAEDIEHGTADLAAVEGGDQILLGEMAAAPTLTIMAPRGISAKVLAQRMLSVAAVSGSRQMTISLRARKGAKPESPW